jgi:glucose/arabinose dehydrogenase
MRRTFGCLLASSFLLGTASIALAQQADNLQKLKDFTTTDTSRQLEHVEQTGAKADQIRKNLQQVKLPQGFKIALYALVPDARHMAVGRNVGTVFVGTRKSKAWAVLDRDKDRVADEVTAFAPAIDFKVPNGPCMSPDGVLYLVEHNRVLGFGAAEFFFEGGPDVAVGEVVPQGQLIPVADESFNHGARTCRIGPDNKLYITLGQRYNVPPADKVAHFKEFGIGGIIRMDRDGKNREVVATGIRNSVGFDFNPKNGELWFTDNQVDGMGDDQPPGELNRLTKVGQEFGFPWYGGGHVRTNEYKDQEPPRDAVFPEVEMAPHAADLGMVFYRGEMFPKQYRGGIFSAQHGSWNRSTPVGARVMFTSLKADGSADKTEVFADGWLNAQTGEYSGRPVDVATLPDGSLLVSDDLVGAIYRISYGG